MAFTLLEYSNAALNAAYRRTAGGMLEQISAMSTAQGSAMQAALTELDDEIERLEADEKPLKPDNAVLLKVLAASAVLFSATAALVQADGRRIEESGQLLAVPAVTAKVFTRLAGQAIQTGKNPINPALLTTYAAELTRLGITWNMPTGLDFAERYVGSAAWAERMGKWGAGYSDLIGKTALEGIQSGWGPRYTASHVRKLVEGMPVHASENLTRTLQLTAFRDASAAMDDVNGEYIEYKLRIAALDTSTCLSCIDQHGERLEKGERVDDHYNGRCDAFYVVKGGPRQPDTMQSDSKPGERNFVPFQSGRDWFNSLPEARQAQQASFIKTPAKLEAFRAGTPLAEFVGTHTDDIFGRQVVELSLIKALGEDARQYYLSNHDD